MPRLPRLPLRKSSLDNPPEFSYRSKVGGRRELQAWSPWHEARKPISTKHKNETELIASPCSLGMATPSFTHTISLSPLFSLLYICFQHSTLKQYGGTTGIQKVSMPVSVLLPTRYALDLAAKTLRASNLVCKTSLDDSSSYRS